MMKVWSPCERNSGPSFKSSSVPCSQTSVGEEMRTRLLWMVHGLDMRAMYSCWGVRSVGAFASHPDHTAYSPPRRRVTGRSIAQMPPVSSRSEEHTAELQSPWNLGCRLLLGKKKKKNYAHILLSIDQA